jgi:hypothetical protein
VNARCSPAGILAAHAADQCADVQLIAGRPGLPCWTFHVQNNRNAFRCQAMTVSGLTMTRAERRGFPALAAQAGARVWNRSLDV